MLDLATTIRRSISSPRVLVKEVWNHDYQDFRLIFEQSDVLHYFYVSSNTQKLIVRVFIVAIAAVLFLIMALTFYSGVSAWRYKNLEASKLLAEQKRVEALNALAALSSDESSYESGNSQEDLIKAAQGYRERLNKMQTLIEFSSQELKLANKALEQGLRVSGIASNELQKIKAAASSSKIAMGGPSDEIKFDSSSNQPLEAYKKNLAQLEQLKQVYKLFPSSQPVSQAITTSKYGVRIHPITNKLTLHEGLDYVPTFDLYARSVLPGVVEKAQYSDNGYGNVVTVLHNNNVRTIYAHLEKMDVSAGQRVAQGAVLGKIGNTGFSTGKHLHYEISIDNIKVNPLIITAMAKNVQ